LLKLSFANIGRTEIEGVYLHFGIKGCSSEHTIRVEAVGRVEAAAVAAAITSGTGGRRQQLR